jgi:hypothetical protein
MTSEPAPATSPEGEPGLEEEADDLDLTALDTPDEGLREVPGCNELEGAGGCPSAGKVLLGCMALGNVLEAEPTDRLVACLARHQGTAALCDTAILETCALAAVDETPPAPTATRACATLFDTCPVPEEHARRFTPERCASGLSAARARPRAEFVGCMRRKCDLLLCVSALL